MDSAECIVIGAGIVGLAIARQLALAGREVVVLEAADAIGTGISARNSEVIHAGLYYAPGSLKARLCVEGRLALMRFCAERGIAHRQCGKLIVATAPDQDARLDAIAARAHGNGVGDLVRLTPAAVRAIEPDLACTGALSSPSSGIVDTHGVMLALQGEAEDRGAMIAFNCPVLGGAVVPDGFVVETGGADPFRLGCRVLVNAAGLGAQAVARALDGLPSGTVPPLHLAKGNYFGLTTPSPFSRLIYPVPEPGGLGIHLTLDLAGRARFGPDVEWIDRIDYDVDPRRADRFAAAIRRYWPGLPDGALIPAYAGIRPKLAPAGAPDADFMIRGPRDHGIPGLATLFGIESPGVTACLAIARTVATVVMEREMAAP